MKMWDPQKIVPPGALNLKLAHVYYTAISKLAFKYLYSILAAVMVSSPSKL